MGIIDGTELIKRQQVVQLAQQIVAGGAHYLWEHRETDRFRSTVWCACVLIQSDRRTYVMQGSCQNLFWTT